MPMSLKSSAFDPLTETPKRFTCDGLNVSPVLSWSNVPQNAKSLVLIVDDPDAPDPAAPKLTWVHWLLYNIPPALSELPENSAPEALPKGTLQGKNDWKETGYRGPCPPVGRRALIHLPLCRRGPGCEGLPPQRPWGPGHHGDPGLPLDPPN